MPAVRLLPNPDAASWDCQGETIQLLIRESRYRESRYTPEASKGKKKKPKQLLSAPQASPMLPLT
jgi:hypothetical protein